MKIQPSLIAALVVLAVAACRPGPAEYTESEAPNRLTLDTALSRVDLRFVAGSDHLVNPDSERLRRLAARGAIAPADRVAISVAGPPNLARARVAAISGLLLRYGIVADAQPLADLGRDHAIISVRRDLVNLPPCPNWSKSSEADFTNSLSSNYGCSTAINLGRMLASPTDLASGRPVGSVDAITAGAAVQRYYADKVTLPTPATIGPIAAPVTGAVGGGGASPGSQ